jgi:hypothetical protein
VGSFNNDEYVYPDYIGIVQIDSNINFENMAPCVPTERYEHHESFFLPTMPAYGKQLPCYNTNIV